MEGPAIVYLSAPHLLCADEIPAAEASSHAGETATVCGNVTFKSEVSQVKLLALLGGGGGNKSCCRANQLGGSRCLR